MFPKLPSLCKLIQAAAGVGSSRVKSDFTNLADLAAGVAVNQVRVATLTCFGVYYKTNIYI